MCPAVNYSVTPNSFSMSIHPNSNYFSLNIKADRNLYPGNYVFNITVYKDGTLIYSQEIYIQMKYMILVDIISYDNFQAIIEPGDTFRPNFSINNIGSVPLVDNYFLVYSDLNSSDGEVQWYECKDTFRPFFDVNDIWSPEVTITPPRHWSTSPREYFFYILVYNPQLNETLSYEYYTITVTEFHEIYLLNITDPSPSVFRPGNTTPSTFEVSMTNLGNVIENIEYQVYIPGFEKDFITTFNTTEILRGDSNSTNVSFIVNKNPLLAPGLYDLTIDFIGESGLINSTQKELEILEFHDVEVTLENTSIITDEFTSKSIKVNITNMGNVPDIFYLDVIFDYPVGNVNFSKTQLNLDPASYEIINLNVYPYGCGNYTVNVLISFYDYDGNLVTVNKELHVEIFNDDYNAPVIILAGNWVGEGNIINITITDQMAFENSIQNVTFQDVENGIYYYEILYQGEIITSGYPDQYHVIDPSQSNMYVNQVCRAWDINTMERVDVGTYNLTWTKGRGIFEGQNTNPKDFAGYITLSFKSNYPILQITPDISSNNYQDPIIDLNNPSDPLITPYDYLIYYPIRNENNVYSFYFGIECEGVTYADTGTQQIKVIYNYVEAQIEIPNIIDDSSTVDIDEGIHNFYLKAFDNDFDNQNPLDRAISDLNITLRIIDDDITPPTITLGKQATVLGGPYKPEYIDETFENLPDFQANLHNARYVGWYVNDTSYLESVNITLQIVDKDGNIIQPETMVYQYQYNHSEEPKEICADFFTLPLIQGTHIVRLYSIDYDTDREGDQLIASKSYNYTISDDDLTPFTLYNLSIDQKIIQDIPIVEITGEVNETGFLKNPENHKILIFVDDEYIEQSNITYELQFVEETPILALVNITFRNIWLENKDFNTHDVEILCIDDDYDIMDPYYLVNEEWGIWRLLEASEGLTMGDYDLGFLTDLIDGTFKFIINYTEDEHPSIINNYFMDFYTQYANGTNLNTVYHTTIPLPLVIPGDKVITFALFLEISHLLAFLFTQNITYQNDTDSESMNFVTLTRGIQDFRSESFGVIEREILNVTVFPQLFIKTPTSIISQDPLKYSMLERMTFIYDLQTGIATKFIVEHIANESVSGDEYIKYFDIELIDTNSFNPYEFNYNDQVLNVFVPPDASMSSIFTNFTPIATYEVETCLTPSLIQMTDGEVGIFNLNITNIGCLTDTYVVNVEGLEVGSYLLSASDVILAPEESIIITILIIPTNLGYDEFTVMVTSDYADDSALAVVNVIDDDIEIPQLALMYTGDGTDGNPGFVNIETIDSSGLILYLNNEEVGTAGEGEYLHVSFNLESNLDPQVFEFIVLDNDLDRGTIDRLSTTLQWSKTLIDDDTTAPLIDITYTGAGTDGHPGTLEVNAYDIQEGDDSGLKIDPSGSYTVSNELGTYNFEFLAEDNDNDRVGDSLTRSELYSVTINDDDITPPEISNLEINKSAEFITISFQAYDESDISDIEILIDGEIVHIVNQTIDGNNYILEIKNDWLLDIGLHTVQINVTDGDSDRTSDSLSTVVEGSFEISVDEIFDLIKVKIIQLQQIVENNVTRPYKYILNHKLEKVMCEVELAEQLYESGHLTKAVCIEKLAKISLAICDFIIQLGDCSDKIEDNLAKTLTQQIHEIRNLITYSMGGIIGSELAIEIADIEIDLLNLADQIKNTTNFWSPLLINSHIWQGCNRLDKGLIYLSQNRTCKVNREITKCINSLNRAKCTISFLNWIRQISDEYAMELIDELNQSIFRLENLS
ncbi:MAG: COG1470 family protein [Candidatus Helarchaeota archaeon]